MGQLETIFQSNNKRSLYSLCPKEIQTALQKIPRAILILDELQLEEEIVPTPTMRLLRHRFWIEYHRIQENAEIFGIDIAAVCESICNPAFFIDKVFHSPHVSAWMVLPPKSYEDAMEETLNMGILRVREIFEIPIVTHEHERDANGEITSTKTKYDSKAANLILRAYSQIDQRVKGGFVQRHQIQTANVTNQLKNAKQEMSMEQIEAKLKELEPADGLLEARTVKPNNVTKINKPEPEDKF